MRTCADMYAGGTTVDMARKGAPMAGWHQLSTDEASSVQDGDTDAHRSGLDAHLQSADTPSQHSLVPSAPRPISKAALSRAAANDALMRDEASALLKKEGKIKQLRELYDIVVPHGATMKELDWLLRVQQRQRGKKEVLGAREHAKKVKQTDIRGNRQRSKSCDWEE